MGRRRERRLKISLPVKVWGMDCNGKPFIQSAQTTDITRRGGRLRDLFCQEKVGEIIRVQHGSQKANFKVTWVGHRGTSADGHVGIRCIDPDKYIWGIPLSEGAANDPYEIEQELLSVNAPVLRDPAGYSDRVAATSALVNQGENRLGKKRVHHRYACNGTVEVGPEGSAMPLWCSLSDVSASGFYAESPTPLQSNTRVYAVLKTPFGKVQCRGAVRTSHPGVGMGVSIVKLQSEDQRILDLFLEKLAEDLEHGRARASHAPSKPSRFCGQLQAPVNLSPSTSHRSLLVAHNRNSSNGNGIPSSACDSGPTERIEMLAAELAGIQLALSPDAIDPRLAQEFRLAMEYARQIAMMAQNWMELQSQKRDPFRILDKLSAERVRCAGETVKHLTIDIDSAAIDLEMDGLNDLYEAVRNLQSRLSKLMKEYASV